MSSTSEDVDVELCGSGGETDDEDESGDEEFVVVDEAARRPR